MPCARAPTDESQPPVVAIFNVAMIGHVNPTFPLVMELASRGCKVHYFLPPNSAIRKAAREAGASIEAYVEDDDQELVLERCGVEGVPGGVPEGERALWERAVWPLASTLLAGDHVIARCRQLGVRAVLFDPIAPHGFVAAEALGIPCVSLVTYPGMGSLAELMEDAGRLERAMAFRRPYALRVRERFGVDVRDQLLTRRQYFAAESIVTTSEDLVVPLPPAGQAAWADELRREFRFLPVGCMVSDRAPHVASAGPAALSGAAATRPAAGRDLPARELGEARARGARVVLAALGTMALSARWDKDLGKASGGNLPAGTTGKVFCQHVWRALLAAMRGLGGGYHCVLCIGDQPDAMDFLMEDELPSNVTLRSSVPQVEMLRSHTDVFLSHTGFNSLQESLFAGVPLIAVPQAVDQPANARKVEASGWGRAFLRPMETVTAEALAAAVCAVTAEAAPYREAVAKSQGQLRGGEARAADYLMALAAAGGR